MKYKLESFLPSFLNKSINIIRDNCLFWNANLNPSLIQLLLWKLSEFIGDLVITLKFQKVDKMWY